MRTARALLVVVLSLFPVVLFADGGAPPISSLLFTANSTARTAAFTPVTHQIDNMRLEAVVNWNGPSDKGSLILYNGTGCCSGWGILVLSRTDTPANALAVLAGGITVTTAPVTLTPGKWQKITMDRVNQSVTLTVSNVSGDDDGDRSPQVFPLGVIPANAIGFHNDQTFVGDAFNGLIASARIVNLDSTGGVIESWDFTTPDGTSGRYTLFPATSTRTGANGHVLNLSGVSLAVRTRHDD